MDWIVKRDGHQTSIRDAAALREWAQKGGLKRSDLVFHPDLQRWLYAHEVLELEHAFSTKETAEPRVSLPNGARASRAAAHVAAVDAVGLARNYRQLVATVGLQLVLSLFVLSDTLTLILLPAIIATSTALAYFAYRTAEALGSQSGLLWAAAMFVPCINMFTLLALSAKATAACRTLGIKVGFLGPIA